ncbi:MAG: prepilin-type N-terminal cleavage/methylation domain-containing protein [Candidatus Stahlbacteria bacterium]|nr:prepilin-type N-terminal cleavage/methylation domain-containing protein [Candidatus Stahlbacteria bacterium]
MSKKEYKKQGFTIIEIMTVVAILGIVAGIAIPTFRNYIPRMKLIMAKDEIIGAMRLARTKAITEKQVYQVIFVKGDPDSFRVEPGANGESTPLPTGVTIFDPYGIIYEFNPDRTARSIPHCGTLRNVKNKAITFRIIEATGYVQPIEWEY